MFWYGFFAGFLACAVVVVILVGIIMYWGKKFHSA